MPTGSLLIGTCGFPSSRKKVFRLLDAVEIQSSFYNPLSENQLIGIKKDKPDSVELTLKAWSVITHPSSSPVWRKLKAPPPGRKENYGWLRPTKENLEALDAVLEQARRIEARVVVFQTPASMPLTEKGKGWIEEFFRKALEASGETTCLAWEPRGQWFLAHDFLEKLVNMGIVIVSDYLRKGIPPLSEISYTRLHGLGGRGEVNYKYKYNLQDLERLLQTIERVFDSGVTKAYVMFNNVYMLDDALEFKKLVDERWKDR